MTTSAPAATLPGLSNDAFSSMFQAVAGLRNGRAVVAMLGSLCAGVLVAGLLSVSVVAIGFVGPFLAGVLFLIALATGVNAAGLLLMDQARGMPLRSLTDALVYGLMCIPKLIVLALALLAIEVVVFITLALLFVVCKIPFLGPLLFVVVFPVSVVIAGVTVVGLVLCLLLALPAVWEGSSVTRAIAQTLAIARTRLVEALVLLAVVGLLCAFVGFIVLAVLGSGLLPTLGMSMGIVGGLGGGLPSVMGLVQGAGGGYAAAAAIGGGLLWALALTLLAQVYLLGLNLVYLRVTEGLDTSATEAAMRSRLNDAKRLTSEIADRAKTSANPVSPAARPHPPADDTTRIITAAPDAAPAVEAAVPHGGALHPAAASCPKCQAACSQDDLFCGVCGQRLTA